jgi:hypothetical protein
MITLSLNFDGLINRSDRASHQKKVREIVDTHLGFPGSDKLKMGLTIKDNGSSSVTFAGPKDLVSEARRVWEENGKPAVNKVRSVAAKTAASVQQKAKSTVKKTKKAAASKVKAVKAVVKKKPASKKKAPAKKKK